MGKYENFPYPGIEDALGRLKAAGFTLYVATSKPEEMSIEILTHFGLAPYFDRICGGTPDGSRDEKAQVIAYLRGQIPASQAVMVGDTVFDVLGAAAHGLPTVGVSWGYGEVQAMKDAGAVAIVDTPGELTDLLLSEKLWKEPCGR